MSNNIFNQMQMSSDDYTNLRQELRDVQREELEKIGYDNIEACKELSEKQIINTMNKEELIDHIKKFPELKKKFKEIRLFLKGKRTLSMFKPLFKGVSGNHWGAWRS